MDGPVLHGVVIDQAIEVLFQCTRDFGRSPGAGAIHQPPRALGGKAMDPFAQRRIGQVQRLGDRLEAVSCHNVADRLGTPEHTGFLGLPQEGLSGGQGVIRKMEFEGPHDGGLQNKILQKYKHPTCFPYCRSTAFPTQIFQVLL